MIVKIKLLSYYMTNNNIINIHIFFLDTQFDNKYTIIQYI